MKNRKCLMVLLFSTIILVSLNQTNAHAESNDDDGPEIEGDEKIVAPIGKVEFLSEHKEATLDSDFVDPDDIVFNVNLDEAAEIVLSIEVDENDELILGRTHFQLEYLDGEDWKEIENTSYGAEDGEEVTTSDQVFEYTIGEQYDVRFQSGLYRIVNAGYIFPFYVYELNSTQASSEELEPTQYDIVNNFNDVIMVVKEDSVSPTEVTLVFENHSENEAIYSDDFVLEKESNGNWYQVPTVIENYGFNDIGYNLLPDEVEDFTVEWEWLYGSLDSGKYRVVKRVLDFRRTGDYEGYYLTAEFTID